MKVLTCTLHTETSTCTLTVRRRGTYGTIDVQWQSGFINNLPPDGFVSGAITPASGTLTIANGVEEKNFTVQV